MRKKHDGRKSQTGNGARYSMPCTTAWFINIEGVVKGFPGEWLRIKLDANECVTQLQPNQALTEPKQS